MQKNLKELFDDYIDECQYVHRLRPETLRSSQDGFRHFSKLVPEASLAVHLSPGVITVFFKRLQTRERTVGKNQTVVGVRDSTIRTYAGRLSTFFKWLANHGYIAKNPFDSVTVPHPKFTDHRALKGKEIQSIMGAIAQHAPNAFLLKRDLAMVSIMTFCGLRRSELLALQTQDIDIYNGILTVQGATSKSKATRRIPINLYLKKYLEDYLDERKKRKCKTSYLLVSNQRDSPLTRDGLKHWIERFAKFSGIKFHAHRFRHSFATNLAMQNVSAVKIQHLMGHSSLNMTQVYLRSVSSEDMRNEIDKLSFDTLA